MTETPPTVGLFVTCLVDLFRPSVGFAAVELLERAGCRVVVPEGQTCCGQPAYNSGARDIAASIAQNVLKSFEGFDYVVAPSGSCAAMLKLHLPSLFEEDSVLRAHAEHLAERTWELMSFLIDVRQFTDLAVSHNGSASYHDGCSGLRELGVPGESLRCAVPGRRSDRNPHLYSIGSGFCAPYALWRNAARFLRSLSPLSPFLPPLLHDLTYTIESSIKKQQ